MGFLNFIISLFAKESHSSKEPFEPVHTSTYQPNSVKTNHKLNTNQSILKENYLSISEKQGWKVCRNRNNEFNGYYEFYNRKIKEKEKWEGFIRFGSHGIEVYIKNPPVVLKNHKHAACFKCINKDGWFHVHFTNPVMDLQDAIINVQNRIAEAYIFYSG